MYTGEQVKNALDIYGTMVHVASAFKGVALRDEGHKMAIDRTIYRAKNEFPHELKDTDFANLLSSLEKISSTYERILFP